MTLFADHLEALETIYPLGVRGQVQGIVGMTIEASDLPLPLGALVRIEQFASRSTMAEVIGFTGDRTLLLPLENAGGISRGDRCVSVASSPSIDCSIDLLGRVIDGFGRPIDNLGPLPSGVRRRIDVRAITPMQRQLIREPIDTGIRAIDALHTCGLGQRMGIFSGPGVGKSTLLSSIAKNTSADISVLALIGERGREVQEFIENALGEDGLKRSVVIVSTGDDTPLLKVRAARVACTVAEYFRDSGQHVMLMIDSLTRLAQAQRQIGLAAREPPATKGFTPSVFALLPEILERAGRTPSGSVTGFYTVLVEGDDFNEPIPDAVKGITDGHLWLNRNLAVKGHYPAIDMLQSISRVRSDVTPPDMQKQAKLITTLLAAHAEIADLLSIGAYVPGINAEHDLAVAMNAKIIEFLKQDPKKPTTGPQARKQLAELCMAVEIARKSLPQRK